MKIEKQLRADQESTNFNHHHSFMVPWIFVRNYFKSMQNTPPVFRRGECQENMGRVDEAKDLLIKTVNNI
jgi:hypothetical protein